MFFFSIKKNQSLNKRGYFDIISNNTGIVFLFLSFSQMCVVVCMCVLSHSSDVLAGNDLLRCCCAVCC